MKHYPLPVIICSSLTPKGGDLAMEALNAGAVAVLCKQGSAFVAGGIGKELAELVKQAAGIDVRRLKGQAEAPAAASAPLLQTTNQILAIGASTGGTVALERVLKQLPVNAPGSIVSQHMPELFTASFARRLAVETHLDVLEASDGDSVVPGRVLIAPGNHHLLLKRSGTRYYVEVKQGPLVNRHRPSVDVMFRSAAAAAGANAIGVILTGMGRDGAEGLLAMKQAGAPTIAQDEASCVVFGMPKVAIELGAVDDVVPLESIPSRILRLLQQKEKQHERAHC